MDIDKLRRQARIFRILANPVRLEVLLTIANKKVCVNSLSELVSRRQSNISQHLSIMRNMGIIDCQRVGKKQCYFIIDRQVKRLIKGIYK